VSLADSIRGRVSRANIVNPITDEVIVRENDLITPEIGRRIEEMGLEKIQVRSPMTCNAPLGVCALCYGMDLSTGSMVEQGMAVGIIAAQSIGEPGTQLTMRTFHIGGTAARAVEESEIRSKKPGRIQFTKLKVVENEQGELLVLSRHGEIVLLDSKGRELEQYEIPTGAALTVQEGEEVEANCVLCRWDPHSIPILAEVGGRVRYEDVIEGETMRREKDAGGYSRQLIMEHKGDLHPQIVIEDEGGKILDFHYLPEKAYIEVDEGAMISGGALLAKTPRGVSGTQDITGGLPRVTEIFEARKPKDPAIIAEIDGEVELLDGKRRGKRTIVVRSETGIEREHLIAHGKHLRLHTGDRVRAGEALVDGPLVPHDILRVSGEEAVQEYLTREIQNVYRSQRVEINDKHIEIIVAQMLRKVYVESIGDTNLLPGSVLDKFEFRKANDEIVGCLKITNPGDTDFAEGAIVPKEMIEQRNAQIEAVGGNPAEFAKPQPGTASTQLLGITKASVQSWSFLSAASFQETTKVLTQAALAGKVDGLVGLKENVILGHLVPAGTGFHSYQQSEVRVHEMALDDLVREPRTAPEMVVDSPLLRDMTGEEHDATDDSERPSASESASDSSPESRSTSEVGFGETALHALEETHGQAGELAIEAEVSSNVEVAEETTPTDEEEPKSESSAADQGIVEEAE
jgi:DNA-directed RNA polymerase subunit beta'